MPWWVEGIIADNPLAEQIVFYAVDQPNKPVINAHVKKPAVGTIREVNGPYKTKALAEDAAHNRGGKNPQGPSPLQDLPGGLSAIGDFFARLTEPQTWVRVGEVGAGTLLLYMGLKAVVTPSGQNVAQRTVKDTGKQIKRVAKVVVK